MNALCNGCPDMALESWPKGVQAAKCTNRGNIFGTQRTLATSKAGDVGYVYRPAWCRKGKD